MSTFQEADLRPELIKAVTEMGFENPTPIQEKTLPHLKTSDRDLIALAQTGTGKTAAFSLPVLDRIDTSSTEVQAIILAPTRELCLQIYRDIEKYSKYMKGVRPVAVYGGANISEQIRTLRKGCQIVVGTPGRTVDLLKRGKLKIDSIQWLVLDEADEMLSMGFKDELDQIFERTPESRQTLLFSATMPKGIISISKRYMNNPEEITVGTKNTGAKNVEHEYFLVNGRDRYLALKRLVDVNPDIYAIVFCRTRRETKEIADRLGQEGYNADALHGDLSQAQRDYVMNRFRRKSLQVLVATDVAARGIDVDDLTHVINFNLPDELESYIHRSGRTGRAGKSGKSYSIIQKKDFRRIRIIEQKVGKKFTQGKIPEGQEICKIQLLQLVERIKNTPIDEDQIGQFLPAINEKFGEMSREELIKSFVSMEFNKFLSYYKNAPDLNGGSRRKEMEDKRKGRAKSYSRFFINLGVRNELNAGTLIGLINERTKDNAINIGKIEILKKFSFFEVDSAFEKEILRAFNEATFRGEPVNIELSNKPKRPATEKREYKGGGGYKGKPRSKGAGKPGRPKNRQHKKKFDKKFSGFR